MGVFGGTMTKYLLIFNSGAFIVFLANMLLNNPYVFVNSSMWEIAGTLLLIYFLSLLIVLAVALLVMGVVILALTIVYMVNFGEFPYELFTEKK